MCPKVTKDGSSLQIILPKSVCESAQIQAGATLNVMTDGTTISFVKPLSHFSIEEEEKHKTIFTIGYESRDIDKFINRLKTHGIKQLIDVREKPISRKKGFSKTKLREALTEEYIEYIHMPRLGSPSDIRHEYKEGGSERLFFERYESYLKNEACDQILLLDDYVSSTPSALMCFELSYVHCHRKIIAKELSNIGYEVIHL